MNGSGEQGHGNSIYQETEETLDFLIHQKLIMKKDGIGVIEKMELGHLALMGLWHRGLLITSLEDRVIIIAIGLCLKDSREVMMMTDGILMKTQEKKGIKRDTIGVGDEFQN